MPNDPRVVIITDRDELDKQIENGFKDAGHKPIRAKSGNHLLSMLSEVEPNLICTLIHKFGIAGRGICFFSRREETPRKALT